MQTIYRYSQLGAAIILSDLGSYYSDDPAIRTIILVSSPGTVTEVHQIDRDRVEIVVAKAGMLGWVARLRFVEQDFNWEERSLTADQAYAKAMEFFKEACPGHTCSQHCKRFTSATKCTLDAPH